MTKRPKSFIAVAAWVGLFLFGSLVPMTRVLTGYSGPTIGAPSHFVVTELGVLVFVIVLVVNLVRLHPAAIWITASLAALSGVSALLRLPTLMSSPGGPLVLIPALFGFILNTTCAWYLSRPGFHVLAARLRAEREHEAMRREANRRVRRGAST